MICEIGPFSMFLATRIRKSLKPPGRFCCTFLLTLKGPVLEPHLGQFQRSNDEFVFAEFHEDGKHKGHEAFLLAPIWGWRLTGIQTQMHLHCLIIPNMGN